MTVKSIFILLSLVSASVNSIPVTAHAQPPGDASRRCTALQHADLSKIPDALTQVIKAQSIDPSGGRAGYCEVTGYVAPNISFLLRLPLTNWNGKFIELGCAGWCGSTDHISECDDPLSRGYACIVTDGGHTGAYVDLKWAYNNLPAKIDLFVRASHVTALAGKSIVERYYGHSPSRSYFSGCSGGGSQAMEEAQRFPWDFDGIVAGAAISWADSEMQWLWETRAFTDKAGLPILGQADLEVLHQAVVAKCDLNDGIKDGLIGDPRACGFNPAELLCTATKETQCLTKSQIEAVNKIYGGPVNSKGDQVVMSGALRGSERHWFQAFYGDTEPNGEHVSDLSWLQEVFRYNVFQPDPGPTWNTESFDFDRDYKRVRMLQSLLEPNNADLRKFKAAGGKLLFFDGWNDVINSVLGDVDYYESAERLMGGRVATQDFFRLFVLPGMTHCSGGDGAFAVDYLSYLEAWVEKGKPPDRLVAAHLKFNEPTDAYRLKVPLSQARIEFSRPIYPYPTKTIYSGRGDPNDAASFGPVEP